MYPPSGTTSPSVSNRPIQFVELIRRAKPESSSNLTSDLRLDILVHRSDTMPSDSSCMFAVGNSTGGTCHDSHGGSSEQQQLDEVDESRGIVLLVNFWMLGVFMPLIAIFGILANGAAIVVFTRTFMRSSTINIYLAALSAFDGLLLLMSFLLYPPLNFCEWDHTDPRSPWCRYFFYSALFTYPLSLIMQSCSVWTLCAITVDRFIAINWPLRSRDWCTSRRAYVSLSAIVIWSIVYNLPAFFELRLKIIDVAPPFEFDPSSSPASTDVEFWTFSNTTTASPSVTVQPPSMSPFTQIVLDQTELRKQSIYKVAYKGYCYLFFMLLIPAGAMIVLNVFVTVRVRKAYRWRKATSGREEKERRCTIMAILVVITFLVFNSLAFVNNLIEIFATELPAPGDHAEEVEPTTKKPIYLISVTIGNVLVALNSASNFVIYCALGVRFRAVFCKLFCMERCRPPGASILAGGRYASGIGGSMAADRSYKSVAIRYSDHGREHRGRYQSRQEPSPSDKAASTKNGATGANSNGRFLQVTTIGGHLPHRRSSSFQGTSTTMTSGLENSMINGHRSSGYCTGSISGLSQRNV